MFNSEIFSTEVYPDFNEAFQAKLRVYDKKTKSIKVVDTIDIKRLPERESILVKALIEVSLLKETELLRKKREFQKKMRAEWKKNGNEDFQTSLQLIQMIDSKSKKVELLESYLKEIEYKFIDK